MPREAPAARPRADPPSTRATARTRAVATTSAHAGLPYPPRVGKPPRIGNPPRVGNALRSSNQGVPRQPPPPPQQASGSGQQHPDETDIRNPVHNDCRVIFRQAHQERLTLISQLEEKGLEAANNDRQSNQEKSQLHAQARRLRTDLDNATTEIHTLKQEKLALQKQLDESGPDLQSYLPRAEYEQALDELVTLSSAVTKKIESNKDASQNASQTKEMPPSDALHDDSWSNVDLNIFDDTIDPHHLNPVLSTTDGLPLANLDNYGRNT